MMNVTVQQAGPREGWHLPVEVAEMDDAPLYLAVAMWGMRQKRVITCEDVCRNFYISQRQASDILHYICHEGARFVVCERRKVVREGNICRVGLRIHRVILLSPEENAEKSARRRYASPPPASALTSKSYSGRRDASGARALRQWMIRRRPGDRVPEKLLPTATSGGTE
ncbi:CaiF/GrlA family transcriptional regulator [Salmonella enterica subsp. salamae]|nr:CaiF/GrlA family transcriptional regulator [Salmonella enterica]EDV4562101.1 CaiF/GrlA family transcriptional regulator [Salmonella enterica subsp. enterica]EDV5762532.1 CaiF/GrlA family transcriptional regulator [Salmonella enterica subsp. salamae]HAE4726053.1 CaiF/GrlA family transcriptional regulator [Salmonella enterica subsp. salamae serovar 47:a:1,5]